MLAGYHQFVSELALALAEGKKIMSKFPMLATLATLAATVGSAQAAFTVYTDRAAWLAAAGGAPNLTQTFDSYTSDVLYGAPLTAGFLTLSVVNGPHDISWRIDAMPATFGSIPDVNGSSFATVLASVSGPVWGGTQLSFAPVRALGFDYAGATYSTANGSFTTSRGDVTLLAPHANAYRGFLGVLYTSGETFTSLTLTTSRDFAAGIDNVAAFSAAPVPELPTSAYWLATAGTVVTLRRLGAGRRRA